ncbi:hypothetical protein BGZ63DRAFT_386480 [Mariannaea sp. PMI_226]|nr:hypothetical protein BGZ63DRAFT_386480 [Mariannaea sp. PMI_226]
MLLLCLVIRLSVQSAHVTATTKTMSTTLLPLQDSARLQDGGIYIAHHVLLVPPSSIHGVVCICTVLYMVCTN